MICGRVEAASLWYTILVQGHISSFEWVQDLHFLFWDEEEVNNKLEQVMNRAFDEVIAIADQRKVNNRIAAYILSIDRVARATMLRGIYP